MRLQVKRKLPMVLDRQQISRVSNVRIKHQIIGKKVFAQLTGCGNRFESIAQRIESVLDLDRTRRPVQERSPHIGKAFQIGDNCVGKLVKQGVKGLRCLGLKQELFNAFKVPLEVCRELDGNLSGYVGHTSGITTTLQCRDSVACIFHPAGRHVVQSFAGLINQQQMDMFTL